LALPPGLVWLRQLQDFSSCLTKRIIKFDQQTVSFLPDCSTDRLFRLFGPQSIYTINYGRWSRKWVITIGFGWKWVRIAGNSKENPIFKVPGVEKRLKIRFFEKIGKNNFQKFSEKSPINLYCRTVWLYCNQS